MAEIIINKHRIDFEYVGYSFVIADKPADPAGYAPMIRVDGRRMRLGHVLYADRSDAQAAAHAYLRDLANPSRPDEDTALT